MLVLVLILAGDHGYKLDDARMLADLVVDLVAGGADGSVACTKDVPLQDACNFGGVTVDDDAWIRAFDEKPAQPTAMPGHPERALASMGIYVFNAAFHCEQLARDAAEPASSHDFGRDLIPRLLGSHRVHAHHFVDSCVNRVGDYLYWRDVGTPDAYWDANMDLTHVVPELNLYDDWPIRSLQAQLLPAKFVFDDDDGRRSVVVDSLVSSGCIVSGSTVRRSILFTKVRVAERSLVEDSVVLGDVVIGCGVTLKRVIVDEGCVIPGGFKAGVHSEEDRANFHVTERGVTLITPGMLGQQVRRVGCDGSRAFSPPRSAIERRFVSLGGSVA